ncbi:hypothetical protein BH10PLA2_BH10PLA2_10960 [soil metagenome]
MSDSANQVPSSGAQLHSVERVELANQLFREFRTQCFWHSPPDLVVTEELVPFVIKGLRKYGGRRGFLLAGELQSTKATENSTG